MLEIVLFLWGIGKEHETEAVVLTGPFWPTDATSSQHTLIVSIGCGVTIRFSLERKASDVSGRCGKRNGRPGTRPVGMSYFL